MIIRAVFRNPIYVTRTHISRFSFSRARFRSHDYSTGPLASRVFLSLAQKAREKMHLEGGVFLREESCKWWFFKIIFSSFLYKYIIKSLLFFLICFKIRYGTSPRVRYRFDGKLTHFPLIVFSLSLSLSSIFRSYDHHIDDEGNKSSLFLFATSLTRSFLSFAPLSFSLVCTPSLTCKQAYKHALAHADTQKCPTNTHSRNFSELRYLDKNITAV